MGQPNTTGSQRQSTFLWVISILLIAVEKSEWFKVLCLNVWDLEKEAENK